MPSGSDAFKKHADVISAKRSSNEAAFTPINYFKVDDGQTVRVRFLEQGPDLTWAITHRLRVPGLQYPQDVLCLDQTDSGEYCPACSSDNKEQRARSTKGFVNLIWRGTEDEGYTRAPLYKTNEKGFVEKNPQGDKVVVGFEDGVFLWKCSKTVFAMLLDKDPKYKGLMSRDFVISRQGAEMENTKYAIEPAVIDGGEEGMTVADANLSQNKYDVVALTTPGTVEEMQAILNGQQNTGGDGPQGTFSRGSEQEVFNGAPKARSSAFDRQA